MQQILQSVQSLSSSQENKGKTFVVTNSADREDTERRRSTGCSIVKTTRQSLSFFFFFFLHDNQETLFNDVDALYENYQDLQSSHEQLQALVDRPESKNDSLENQSRRSNLIFRLPLDGSETWEDS